VIEVTGSDIIIGMVIAVLKIMFVDEMEVRQVIMEIEHDGIIIGQVHNILVIDIETII
jgi:hypothetical protein